MEEREIKRFSIKSILKIVPLIFLLLGLLIGVLSFIYLNTLPGEFPGLGFWGWLLAILLYGIFSCIISSVIIVVAALVYNWLSSKIGGIKVILS